MKLNEKCKCGAEFTAEFEAEDGRDVVGELRMMHSDWVDQHAECSFPKEKMPRHLDPDQIEMLYRKAMGYTSGGYTSGSNATTSPSPGGTSVGTWSGTLSPNMSIAGTTTSTLPATSWTQQTPYGAITFYRSVSATGGAYYMAVDQYGNTESYLVSQDMVNTANSIDQLNEGVVSVLVTRIATTQLQKMARVKPQPAVEAAAKTQKLSKFKRGK